MAFVLSLLSNSINDENWFNASTNYVVETDAGVLYQVYMDSANDVMFSKSSDGGKNWAAPVTVFTGTAQHLTVWFDKWSGLAGGLIHCAYSETGGGDVLYRSINTASADALGTQTTVFAGASIGGNTPGISITRTLGGNILCCGTIDDGTENFARRSTDVGATWGDIAAVMEAAAGDQIIMAPGFAADNQDAMCFFWDASEDEVSVKFYDDSGNSWSEVSLGTGMVELASTTSYPNWSVAVDLTNTYVIMAAWSATDLANADLRIWTVNESAQTEKTNVVLNSTDDQGLCAVSLDTTNGDVYVMYCGTSGGTETWNTALNVYYKVSTDDMATWGSETRLTPEAAAPRWLMTNPRQVYLSAEIVATFANPNAIDSLCFSSIAPTLPTEAQVQSGVDYGINGVEFEGTYAGAGSGGNANIMRGSTVS